MWLEVQSLGKHKCDLLGKGSMGWGQPEGDGESVVLLLFVCGPWACSGDPGSPWKRKDSAQCSMAPRLGSDHWTIFFLVNILCTKEGGTSTEETSQKKWKKCCLFFGAAFIFLVNYLFINLDSEISFWLSGDKSSRSQGKCFQMLNDPPPT